MQMCCLLLQGNDYNYDIDVNTSDNEGWTPLHIAALFNQHAILKPFIVGHMIKDKSNNTAIDYSGLHVCWMFIIIVVYCGAAFSFAQKHFKIILAQIRN